MKLILIIAYLQILGELQLAATVGQLLLESISFILLSDESSSIELISCIVDIIHCHVNSVAVVLSIAVLFFVVVANRINYITTILNIIAIHITIAIVVVVGCLNRKSLRCCWCKWNLCNRARMAR